MSQKQNEAGCKTCEEQQKIVTMFAMIRDRLDDLDKKFQSLWEKQTAEQKLSFEEAAKERRVTVKTFTKHVDANIINYIPWSEKARFITRKEIDRLDAIKTTNSNYRKSK